jgi:hypothetical protein
MSFQYERQFLTQCTLFVMNVFHHRDDTLNAINRFFSSQKIHTVIQTSEISNGAMFFVHFEKTNERNVKKKKTKGREISLFCIIDTLIR